MRARRLVAVALLVMAAAACGDTSAAGSSPGRPVPSSSDPAAVFAAAKSQLGRESARFALDTGTEFLDYTGLVNARTRSWEVTGAEFVVRRVGDQLYVKASGRVLSDMMLLQAHDRVAAGGWAHTRLPNGREYSTIYNDQFPWNLATAATRATGVTRTGERSFTGELTIEGSTLGSTPKPDEDARVDVDLDAEWRFTRISVGLEPVRTTFTFSGFGVAADITAPPPGEVAEEENPAFLTGIGLP